MEMVLVDLSSANLRHIAQQLYDAIVEAGRNALQVQISPRIFNAREALSVDTSQTYRELVTASVDEDVLRFMRHKVDSIAPLDGYWEEVGTSRRPGGHYWCIGKVDGAINFVRNMSEWTLTLSLFEINETGAAYPILGIVHAPALGMTYLAVRSEGAIRIRHTSSGDKRQRIIPTTTRTLAGSVVSFGMSYFAQEPRRAIDAVARMAGLPADIKRIGPASLDLCKVADGTYDAYFEPTLHHWDIPAVSAGSIIVWESGARLRRWDDSEINWYENNDIVASNGLITDELQKYLIQ
ncbi:putative inositol monophosphatase [Scardovia inopinata JCM 12537]|nr:putative inositol monophosphatase [Scardovia inopinata JCM 12537]